MNYYFPLRLKKLRLEKGLSQKELATKLNVSQNAIHNWENGKREPNMGTLWHIAYFFDVSASYLLGDDYETASVRLLSGIDPIDLEKYSGNYTIDCRQTLLNSSFEKLNDIGKEEALKRVEELTEIPKYRKEED